MQLHLQSGPAWTTIPAWQRLPGSVAMLEMALRQKDARHIPHILNLVISAALASMVSGMHHQAQTSSSCAARISLIATVHKVLQLHSSSRDDTPILGYTPHKDELEMELCETQEILRAALKGILASTKRGKQLVAAVTSTSGSSISCHQHGPHSSSKAGTSNSPILMDALDHQQQQLRAVLAMVLVWVCNLRLWAMNAKHTMVDWGSERALHMGWNRDTLGLSWDTEVGLHDAELAAVVRQLLLPLQPAEWSTRLAAFKHEARAWDGYAIGNFHGRLLPGCSFLGCTNLSGCSEASLVTLVCGGCRRMRYCSVGCQRAAWAIGGHSVVCGKGSWTASGVAL